MTFSKAFQAEYDYNVNRNYKGTVARPGENPWVDFGIAGEDLSPGDAVLFDYTNTERDFKKPVAATLDDVIGIVLYNEGTVANDTDGTVVIKSGQPVRVGVKGSFYAEAGTDLEYLNQVGWNVTDGVWDLLTEPATYALAHRNPAFCVERTAADGNLFVVRFSGPIR